MPLPVSAMATKTSSPRRPVRMRDVALAGDGLAGIDQQVHEHLVELRGQAPDLGQVAVVLDAPCSCT